VIGLYKAIYGINPLYNRLYLNPHLPEKLSGTELIYNFRNDKLKIGLATNNYSISNNQFKVIAKSDFGFYANKNELIYFKGKEDTFSLKLKTNINTTIEIIKWDADEYNWLQYSNNDKGKTSYTLNGLKVNSFYTIIFDNKSINAKSDKNGVLHFDINSNNKFVTLTVKPLNN